MKRMKKLLILIAFALLPMLAHATFPLHVNSSQSDMNTIDGNWDSFAWVWVDGETESNILTITEGTTGYDLTNTSGIGVHMTYLNATNGYTSAYYTTNIILQGTSLSNLVWAVTDTPAPGSYRTELYAWSGVTSNQFRTLAQGKIRVVSSLIGLSTADTSGLATTYNINGALYTFNPPSGVFGAWPFVLKTDTNSFIVSESDPLWKAWTNAPTLYRNLNMGGNWISGDSGSDGITVNASGQATNYSGSGKTLVVTTVLPVPSQIGTPAFASVFSGSANPSAHIIASGSSGYASDLIRGEVFTAPSANYNVIKLISGTTSANTNINLQIDGTGIIGFNTAGSTPYTMTIAPHTTGGQSALLLEGYGTGTAYPNYYGRRARGTLTTPSAVLANDELLAIYGRGYGETQWIGSAAGMTIRANENWNNDSNGAYIVWETTAIGSSITGRQERMRLTGAGYLGIGTTNPTERLSVLGNISASGAITGNVLGCTSFDLNGTNAVRAAIVATNSLCWTYALPTTNWGPMVTAASTITRITAQAYSGGMTANVYVKFWTNGWGNLTLLGTMPCIADSSQSNFSWSVPVNSMVGISFPGGATQEVVFSVDVLQ